MSKKLLIESCEFLCNLDKTTLQESLQVENKNNRIILKGVPCTILNKKNQNGRIYSESNMSESIRNAKNLISSRAAYCQSHDHPQGSYVKPIEASHIVTNAYIEKVDGVGPVLFNDWEVLDTRNGRDLRALIEANCSIGTSIRGLGNMKGDSVVDYEFLGTDCVGNPSSSTYTRMFEKPIVVESVEVKEDEDFATENTGNSDDNINLPNMSSELTNTNMDSVDNEEVAQAFTVNNIASNMDNLDGANDSGDDTENVEFNIGNTENNSNVNNNANLNTNSSLGENNMNNKVAESAEKAISNEPAAVTTPAEVNVTQNTPAVKVLPDASNPHVGEAPSEKDPATVQVANVADVVNVTSRESDKLAIRNRELMDIISKHNDEMSEMQRELDNKTKLLGEAINRLKAYKAEFGESTMESLAADKKSAVESVKEQAVENTTKFIEQIVDRATNMVEEILSESKVHVDAIKAKYEESQKINGEITKYFKASQKINESLSAALRTVYNQNRKSVRVESAAHKYHAAHAKARLHV